MAFVMTVEQCTGKCNQLSLKKVTNAQSWVNVK